MFTVVDTSSIIHQPELLSDSYPDDTLVIPITVIGELDKLKKGSGATAASARHALSIIDEMRDSTDEADKYTILPGISSPEGDVNSQRHLTYMRPSGQWLVIAGFHHIDSRLTTAHTGHNDNDLAIISVALQIYDNNAPVQILTQDRGLAFLSEMVGIPSLRHVSVPQGLDQGVCELINYPGSISDIYAQGAFYYDGDDITPNSGVIIKEGNSSALGIMGDDSVVRRVRDDIYPLGITPKDAHQTIAIDLMSGGHNGMYPEEFLGALSGRSGSGKTTLAIAIGLSGVSRGVYDRVMVFRPAEPVGKDVGFLPGSIEEKMAPWALAVKDVIRDLDIEDGIKTYDDRGNCAAVSIDEVLSVENVNFVRGRTFTNTFVIVDEAQNLTVTELRTLASRCGMGSAFVCTFDPSQIDNAYLRDGRAEGVEEFLEPLIGKPSVFHIQLNTPVRGGISALVD